jgi:TonB family protein
MAMSNIAHLEIVNANETTPAAPEGSKPTPDPTSEREPAQPAAQPAPLCVGQKLAKARADRGLSLEDVHEGTKIKLSHLAAIEASDRAQLPATPYTAGFIRAYAQFLGLNPYDYSTAYRAEVAPHPPMPDLPATTTAGNQTHALRRDIETTPTPEPASATLRQAPQNETTHPALVKSSGYEPEKLVTWFGVAATAFCVLWIAGKAMAPKGGDAPDAPLASVEAPAPKPMTRVASAASETANPATIPAAEAPASAAPAARLDTTKKTEPADAPAAASGAAPQTGVETGVDTSEVAAPTPAQKVTAAPAEEQTVAAPLKEKAKTQTPDLHAAESERVVETRPTRAAEEPRVQKASEPRIETVAISTPVIQTAPTMAEPMLAAAPTPLVKEPKIVEPKLTKSATPNYPERCANRAAAVESVEVTFVISAEGRPAGARVTDTSNACFDSAAIDAANRMRFSPKTVDGKPTTHSKTVTIRFQR